LFDIIHHKNIKCPKCGKRHNAAIQIKALENLQAEYCPGDTLPQGSKNMLVIEGLGKCGNCNAIYTLTTQVVNRTITKRFKVSETMPEISVQDAQKLFIEFVVQKVCDKLVVDPNDLGIRCRKQEFVFARHCVWHVVKKRYPKISLSKLAAIFVFTDHATVIHGQRKFRTIFSSPAYKDQANLIKEIEAIILT
jgi:hypothetical protein